MSTSQGTPRTTNSHSKLGRSKLGHSPGALSTPQLGTVSFQNSEGLSGISSPSVCDTLLQQCKETIPHLTGLWRWTKALLQVFQEARAAEAEVSGQE